MWILQRFLEISQGPQRISIVKRGNYKVVKGLRNGVVPVDVFWVVTKISGVVDLVLKELNHKIY